MHEHMRAVHTMLTMFEKFSQIYMKWTYFLFDISNYVLLLQWGNFILSFYSDS